MPTDQLTTGAARSTVLITRLARAMRRQFERAVAPPGRSSATRKPPRSATPRPAEPLPATAVDDLVERAAVGLPDRHERAVGRIAEREQRDAEAIFRGAEQPAQEGLILDRGVTRAD